MIPWFTTRKCCITSVSLTLYFSYPAVKPLIISVTASSPARKEIYGLDRRMNFHRSCDSGQTWRQITDAYLTEIQKESRLVRATPLPETLVSDVPTANLTAVANSTGVTWGGESLLVHNLSANVWTIHLTALMVTFKPDRPAD